MGPGLAARLVTDAGRSAYLERAPFGQPPHPDVDAADPACCTRRPGGAAPPLRFADTRGSA